MGGQVEVWVAKERDGLLSKDMDGWLSKEMDGKVVGWLAVHKPQ